MTIHVHAWINLETTGLDYDRDFIIEAALIVASATPPFELLATSESVICPPDPAWRDRMPPFVREMHETSGLLPLVPGGIPLEEVDETFAELIAEHAQGQPVYLAGSGVSHFDHELIKRYMPMTAEHLAYATLDVGVVRRALEATGRPDLTRPGVTLGAGAVKAHRAMVDLADHYGEWLAYSRMLASLPLL